jgi:hypothetical protein
MKRKLNCWEFMMCGREENGPKTAELGVCPAAADTFTDGINNGKNGGRICWAVAGTFCGDKIQGTFAEKKLSCMTCDFFKMVEEEEGVGKFKILSPRQSVTKG